MSEIDPRAPHERLREARLEAGYRSARAAAKRFNWAEATYGAHENGSRKFGLETARDYGRAFKRNPIWIVFGTEDLAAVSVDDLLPHSHADAGENGPPDIPTIGTETGRRGIPEQSIPQLDVTGGMGGGGITIVSDGVAGRNGMTFAAEHVRSFWIMPPEILSSIFSRPQDIAAFDVQGDSMYPTLSEGDVVFIDTRHRAPSPPGLYALADEYGGIIVKRLEIVSRRSDPDVVVRVISDNPRHSPRDLPADELQIVGRVVRRFGSI